MSRRQGRNLEGSTFGQRLREARKFKGFTQEQLAREINMTLRSVQRWEADEVEPYARQLSDVAQALGVEMGDLMPHEPRAAA
jgi:transcriptional regulator with XRE-family HTH domain